MLGQLNINGNDLYYYLLRISINFYHKIFNSSSFPNRVDIELILNNDQIKQTVKNIRFSPMTIVLEMILRRY